MIRVLVVDDVADLRELVRIRLELESGFAVVGEASNGAEAIELAAQTQPDLILLDLAMPIMDGLQALPELRRTAPNAQIAVLSGFEEATMAQTALEAGADVYLDKARALIDVPQALLALSNGNGSAL